MRYYLDTNILVYMMTGDKDNISLDVDEIIGDYANTFLTSSVCVHEFNDRIPVISSDDKFKDYRKFGLEFVFNKR